MMTKLEFIDKINDILIGLNTAESDALGSLYDELMRPQWIPVEEELPEKRDDRDSSNEVVTWDGTEQYVLRYNYIFREWMNERNTIFEGITHWMEIQPPQGKEE